MDQSVEAYSHMRFPRNAGLRPEIEALAIEYCAKAIELDPSGNNGSYCRRRGMSKFNEGDCSGAEFDYGKSLGYHDEGDPAYGACGEARGWTS